MTQERLDEVLERHELWLKEKISGARAILIGEDLRGVKLRNANLEFAILRGTDLSYANLEGANFKEANLEGVELWGANLFGAIGNRREIKTIQTKRHSIVLTKYFMQISHEAYCYGEWWSFTDEQVLQILDVDGRHALSWWKEWKPILKQIVEAEGF